jgi:hypothetical protein
MRFMAVTLGVVLIAHDSPADDACSATDVEYTLGATLTLSDTPMGAGDGSYAIGPGKVVLRFDHGDVKMLTYTMRESFSIHATTAFLKTTIVTDATSTAAPDDCSIAEGTISNGTLHWRTPVRAYRTDGTLTCSGAFCGSFGAPPHGQSPFHAGPAPQQFNDFVFSSDMKTFAMSKTAAVKTTVPKQSSAVSMSGREVRRTCAAARGCLH